MISLRLAPALRRLPLLLLVLACSTAFGAPVRTEHVEAELIAERTAAEPGRPVALALRLRMIPGWHTYWRNPGDSGQPTTLDWKLPPGVTAGAIQWPAPQRLPAGPLMNFGYEGEVLLASELTVPRDASGTLQLAARASWLVCSEERCIPEDALLTLALPVGGGAPSANAPAFARTRAALPVRAESLGDWRFAAQRADRAVELQIVPPPGLTVGNLRYFPYDEGRIHNAGAQALERSPQGLRLSIPVALQPVGAFTRVAGLLVADRPLAAGGAQALEIDVPVGAAAPVTSASGLGVALLFAFLGGLILNLMPCVLPILSIKVLGFAAHGAADRRAIRTHGALYALGVIASFWLLAGSLMLLKALGSEAGWGFQLQSPLFIALLALLFFGLALNLSGVFEVGRLVPARLLAARSGDARVEAFLTGVLAVAIASPCTAPFMGAALGYALAAEAWSAWLVFTALGAGMALPYVALAWHPQWLARVPKPGAWMVRLRQFLAFPLYGTVIWLLWVLGMQAGLDAVVILLAALLALAIAGWLAGPMPWAAAALAFASLAIAWPATRLAPPVQAPQAASLWQPYSAARLAALAAAGRPAFVDFTAAWCVTCQVNKQLVLGRPDIEQAFSARGVALLRADWTLRDDEITRALAALGRKGVPVYAIYLPGREPQLLPEILTRETILAALERITTKEPAT